MKTATLILTILATAFANGVFAQQAGDLDSTFGRDGIVITDFDGANDDITSVAIQPDGKIVVAGYSRDGAVSDFALARYNPDGSSDTTFGSSGKLTTAISTQWDEAIAVFLQSDRKILAAGVSPRGPNAKFALARYNTDGSLDTTFSSDGIHTADFGMGEPRSAAMQPDGKIVAAGGWPSDSSSDFSLARYNADGTSDSSFGINGTLTTDFGERDVANAIALQPDGKIVAAGSSGSEFALARYNTDGTLDTTFSTDGKLTTDFGSGGTANAITFQPDGKIVAAGDALPDGLSPPVHFALARYNTDGSLDSSFSTDGMLTTDFGGTNHDGLGNIVYSVVIQPDGKFVAAGTCPVFPYDEFALARYNTDGSLDDSFGTAGKVITAIESIGSLAYAVAIQSDGKIVAVGYTGTSNRNFALARYLSGLNVGILVFSPAENVLIYPNPIQNNEVLEYSLQQDEVLSIGLYDISGRLVKQLLTHESRAQGAHKESLNFGEALAPGNYMLRITNGSGSMSVKVVKQ